MRHLRFPMVNSTLADVHEPLLDIAWNHPFPDPTAELLPEITPWPHHFQGQYPMSSGTNHRTFPDAPDQARTDTWDIPDDSLIRNINTQCPMLIMGQFASFEHPASHTVSHRNEIYGDNLITEHHPSLTASIVPLIKLPTTGFGGDETCRVSRLPQHFSNPYYQPAVSPCPNLLSLPGPNLLLESLSKSPSPAVNRRSSQECYDLWKKIPEDAIIITGSDEFVPQTLYRPLTKADKERYLELVHLSPPVIFLTKEPLEWGIPLEDVRNGRMQHLADKDDPVLQNCGPSVSIRINWPGYSSFKRHIPSRNWRKMKGPITKEKLARSLTKIVGQFIEEMSHMPLEVDGDRNWRVGAQYIKVEDLILVSLHHVSKGSWQPQFRLRRNL